MTRACVCPQLEQTREGADGTTPEWTLPELGSKILSSCIVRSLVSHLV